jgi:Ca-activated chloride channel family protein
MISAHLLLVLGLTALLNRPIWPSPLDRSSLQSQDQTKAPPVQRHGTSRRPEDRGPDDPTIRLATDVVTFTVTVTDGSDKLISGLDRGHFEVFEDKVKQQIEFFSDEDVPISVGIIFDVSGSMGIKLDRAREALKAFIQTSHAEDDLFLIGFNRRPNLLAEFAVGESLLNNLTLVGPRGGTALYDAVYLGIEKVKQGRHQKKVLLLISDGQDNSSRYTYRELRKLLKETDVQIYCIGIVQSREDSRTLLDKFGETVLEEISSLTGGKTFLPQSESELEDITARIALELRRQYSIGYVPTVAQRDGKWRKIGVKINRPHGLPKLYVRAKEGYYASAR